MKKKAKVPVASAAVEFLNSVGSDGVSDIKAQNFLDFARKWTDIVNRGGLIKINDDMFIFVRRVENVVRRVLNIGMLKSYDEGRFEGVDPKRIAKA